MSRRVLVAALCLAGCSPGPAGDGPDPDAGPFDAGFAPAPPEPPRTLPCPDGWRARTDPDAPDIATCDPWPEGGPVDCPSSSAHFPGTGGCTPLGAPCPAGDYADGLPASGVLYVRAGAPQGGDGTMPSPFAEIRDALAVASDGDTVALSKGTFDEIVTISRAVTLRGACAAETTIASSQPSDSIATVSLFAAATLQDLRVSGARPGIGVEAGGAAVDSVLVEDTIVTGVGVISGSLEAQDLVVRGTRPRSVGDFGIGLLCLDGTATEVRRGAIEGNMAEGVLEVGAGTTLALTDVAVRRTGAQQSDGRLGRGIEMFGGATATLERVALSENHSEGLAVHDAGTELVATDLVVATTLSANRTHGYGIEVAHGGRAVLERTVFEANRSVGVLAWQDGSEVAATDTVVRDTIETELDTTGGMGLVAADGASMELVRVAVLRNTVIGVGVAVAGASLSGSDVLVFGTRSERLGGAGGEGIEVLQGGSLDLVRAASLSNRMYGVNVSDEGSEASLGDLRIAFTVEQACADADCADLAGGTGLAVSDGAHVSATRFVSTRSALCGVPIVRGGTMDLDTGVVSGNRVGANVRTEGFDLDRIQAGVAYVDNERDLDTTNLPAPDPAELPEL